MKKRMAWVLVGALLAATSVVGAQEMEEKELALVGKVVDGTTGRPLLGAFVHLEGEDWGVVSDPDGLFRLPGVSASGTLSIGVEQLGYVDLLETLAFPEEGEMAILALTPDPILLEGLQVVLDRFERRRRAHAFSTQVLDREDLVTTPHVDLVDLIQSRSFLNPAHCPPGYVESLCAVVRGRVRPVSVYVDEMPMLGGLDFLSMVQPQELHLVEVYYSQGHVRVYTEGFMERTGRRPMALMPIGW